MNHLVILPVLIPLLGAALSLFVEHRRYGPKVQRSVAWASMAALAVSVALLVVQTGEGRITAYLLGDWPARLGVALVADRLAGWMLGTTLLLAIACLLYACTGWDRRAPHFHALFQFQLMGLNGAFLTGDIFNLFVFFEVLLIASYGLLLSGGRGLRLRIGLHYVMFNIAASTLFLIALAMLYATLGSLNMAEISQRIAGLSLSHLKLAKAALGLLLLVFCSKAALLPLYLWLPESYSRAPAAVAALFVIMTKVGLYAVLRVSTLWFGAGAGALAGYGGDWLLWAGLATLLLAGLGALAATRMSVLVAYLVVVSAATLFIAFALGNAGTISAGLYYLPHSTFTAAALFLVVDLIRRRRIRGGQPRDGEQTVLPGKTVPGLLFLVGAVAVAGLPPLAGFLAKAALLSAVPQVHTGVVWTVVLGSSLLVIMGLTRTGIRLFWHVPGDEDDAPEPEPQPAAPARPYETTAACLLLGYVVLMSVFAAPLMRQTDAIATQLLSPEHYLNDVRGTTPQMRQP
ncbi:monovalent cation/H+ antiporter subunit D [Stenotrophomonas sp. STM01]|uniref:monovalent cation/H+ antiporter subunit D n=1 Tax=Stenotrophomonas sp. STM01 TaxID=2769278 RepID=UPI00178066B0|nr:monovalent cation/H+ antiporter subunit D [Stenotrophomonas sp. STM01]MBD9535694.1 monovalent cation/H+ antiporter subunit D [Stenotrophomonas sp. STM01]